MLSYELCKKLKEAGFPLKETIVYQVEPGIAESMGFVEIDGKHYMQPYLSELISEVTSIIGSTFALSNETDEGWKAGKNSMGLVQLFECEGAPECSGETPEEAVCHLYLARQNETN